MTPEDQPRPELYGDEPSRAGDEPMPQLWQGDQA